MVAGAILCQFVSVSVGQAVVGVFMQPVIAELGWQVWQYTLGPSLSVGIGALSGILAGPILDKRGPRVLILVGAIACALLFYGLGHQSQLWLFWLLYLGSGLIGWNLFGPTVINPTLTKWFVRKRGWALAIGSIGVSLAGLIAPVTMTAIVDSMGWRNGYSVLAFFTLVVIVPIAFVMRRTPEDLGLLPDGDIGEPSTATERIAPTTASTPSREKQSLTRAEALRTSSFWLLVLGFGFNQTALSSVLVFAIPFATTAGFTRGSAALGLAVNGLGNLVSKAVWGYTLQYIEPRRLIVIAYSLSSLGVGLMLVAAAVGNTWVLFLGFFFYGFGFGGTIPLSEFLWAKYFGRTHIGAIRGISQPISIIGPMLGPILIGFWYDSIQSYRPAFLAIIAIYLTGALFIWISREPKCP